MQNEFEIIDRYFDGECAKEDEIILFAFLSKNAEAREYFKSLNKVKENTRLLTEELPDELEKNIFHSIENSLQKKRKPLIEKKIRPYFFYAAAIIVLFAIIAGFWKIREYKKNLDYTVSKVEQQEKLIQLMFNSTLPAAEVNSNFENTIIVTRDL
jgi:hypothetical protein